jgi:hypothetical protein
MPPTPWAVPDEAVDLNDGYLDWLEARGVGNRSFLSGARGFLVRWPDPQSWAGLPLEVRLGVGSQTRPFLNFLMFHGQLFPGYDFLLERRLHATLRTQRSARSAPIWPGSSRAPSSSATRRGPAWRWLRR